MTTLYDDLDVTATDFRSHPELYRIGRGEQGVLQVEPYKSDLLPLWAFRTPEVARASAAALMARFGAYREQRDFVGMDMARKYLQMGYTRARRYANHRGGRKYAADGCAGYYSHPPCRDECDAHRAHARALSLTERRAAHAGVAPRQPYLHVQALRGRRIHALPSTVPCRVAALRRRPVSRTSTLSNAR